MVANPVSYIGIASLLVVFFVWSGLEGGSVTEIFEPEVLSECPECGREISPSHMTEGICNVCFNGRTFGGEPCDWGSDDEW